MDSVNQPAVPSGIRTDKVCDEYIRWPDVSSTSYVRRNDAAGLGLPLLGTHRTLAHETNPTTPIVDAMNVPIYLACLRERFPPRRVTRWLRK